MKKFLAFLGIFVAIVAAKWPLLSAPYFYEEKPYSAVAAMSTPLADAITLKADPGSFANHPLLFPYTASLWAKIFGANSFSLHIFMALISSLGLLCMALAHKKISQKNFAIWLGPALLFLFPDFFIHSTNYRYDIFTAAVGMAFICARISGSFPLFLFTGLALSQSRETVLAFFAGTVLVDIYRLLIKKDKNAGKFLAGSIACALLWSSYFIINQIKLGSFSSSEASNQIVSSIGAYFSMLGFNLRWLFVDDFRFVLTLLAIFGLVQTVFFKKQRMPAQIWYLVLPILFYACGIAFHIYEASYYLFPALPLLYSLFAILLTRVVFYPKWAPLALVAAALAAGLHLNKLKSSESMAENSTDYVLIANVYKEAIDYLCQNFPDAKINAEWPLVYYMQDPGYGYVPEWASNAQPAFKEHLTPDKRADTFLECDQFTPELIVIANEGNHAEIKRQKEFVDRCGYSLMKEFSNRRGKVEIFQKLLR